MENRLEELLRMKEDIEMEIEALTNDMAVDCTLNDMTNDLLDELAEMGEDDCPHCLIKEFMKIAYDLGYEDACLGMDVIEEE